MSDQKKLKNKVKYFFNSPKYERSEVGVFVKDLKPLGNIAIFGGMLRDLTCGGNGSFFSDVDLVIDSNEEILRDYLKSYQVKINSFGGYRVSLNRWKIDIWPLENTWAFRERHVDGSKLEDLVKTTFFTWDAIIYNVNKDSIFHIENYFDKIKSRVVDINLEPNKNPLGIVTKSLQISLKNSAKLSPRLVEYILKNTEDISPGKWNGEENEKNNQIKDTKVNIEAILKKLRQHFIKTPHKPFEVKKTQLSLSV